MEPHQRSEHHKRPLLARSPTLRPDPRHQRYVDPSNDAAIRLVRDFQRADPGLTCPQDLAGAISPRICARKAVLPAIGMSTSSNDSFNDTENNINGSFSEDTRLRVEAPPTIVEPADKGPNHSKASSNVQQFETDEASLSTSTADSGFVDKDLEVRMPDRCESYNYTGIDNSSGHNSNSINNSNNNNYSGNTNEDHELQDHCEENLGDNIQDYNSQHLLPSPSYDEHQPQQHLDGGYVDFDNDEYFAELDLPAGRKGTRHRVGGGKREGRRLVSRNSVVATSCDVAAEEEPRYGDDSMLQPVSHQSVIAEDKLVSSRCRRSSKLLDKLMLSEYNSGQGPASSCLLLAPNAAASKGYMSNASRRFSNGVTMAGQILRPRALPQLPPILKRQRTMERVGEQGEWGTAVQIVPPPPHDEQLTAGRERPCAPSPSLTPPTPPSRGSSDGEEEEVEQTHLQLREDSPVDFIDCR